MAVGVSVATNSVSGTVDANIDRSSILSGAGLSISATTQPSSTARESIRSVSAAGAVGLGFGQGRDTVGIGFAGAGAGSGNTVSQFITASITNCAGMDGAGSPLMVATRGGDVMLSATDGASIRVDGGGTSISATFFGDGKASGVIAVGAAHAESTIADTTQAFIDGSSVTASGNVAINASSNSNIATVAFGVAIAAQGGSFLPASFAGSGAGSYNKITNTTTAAIQDGSLVTAMGTGAGAVSVNASDTSTSTANSGSGSLAIVAKPGLSLAVGAVIANNTMNDTVSAAIGETNGGIDTTTVNSAGGVAVNATSTAQANAFGVAVAASITAGKGAAFSGSGANSTNTITNTVTAAIQNGATVHANGTSAGAGVQVSAAKNDTIVATVGTGALAIGYIGGSVGVSLTTNTVGGQVSAFIGGATVTTVGQDINVNAESGNNITGQAVATALSVSIGGAGAGGNSSSEDDTTTSAYVGAGSSIATLQAVKNGASRYGALNIATNAGGMVSAETDGGAGGLVAIGAFLASATVGGGTASYFGNGVSLAVGNLAVKATGSRQASSTTIAAGIGIAGGQGTNATTTMSDNVEAYLGTQASAAPATSESTYALNGSLQVSAISTDTGNSLAGAGLGGGFAISGNTASSTVNPTVRAYVSDNINVTTPANQNVTVSASATNTSKSDVTGIVAAGFGVGVSKAVATDSATVLADVGQGTLTVGGNLSIAVSSIDTATANSHASGGGVLAGANGADAVSTIGTLVKAFAGDSTGGALLNVTGAVGINAEETPNATANSFGVTVGGGLAVGVILASATVTNDIEGYLADHSKVTAGSLTVSAVQDPQSGQSQTAQANVQGGSGGILLGGAGGTASASTQSTIAAYTGSSVTLPDGDVSILATNQTSQLAKANGGAAGGILSVGIFTTEAQSGGTTSAALGTGNATSATRTGSLTVQATGSDENTATTAAGSGSIIGSGQASLANTGDNATVESDVSGTISAGTVTISAQHTSTYAPTANSTNAGLVGGSGAVASNADTSNALVNIADSSVITVQGAVNLTARNQFIESTVAGNFNAVAGAGGAINGAGATSESSPTGTASVTVGNNVMIMSGTDPISSPGEIALSATTLFKTSDSVKLSSGGLAAGSRIESTLNATLTNTVSIGQGSTLFSYGNIDAGTSTQANGSNQANGFTFGAIAAFCNAYATTNITSNQTVSVGKNTTISAVGNVNLTPGNDALGLTSTLVQGSTIADSYANALIGVPSTDASSALASNTALTVATGDVINSGQNVTIGSYPGVPAPDTSANYTATAVFIPISNPGTTNSSAPTTSTVVQDGTITSGYAHALNITIPKNNPSTPIVNADGAPYFPFAYALDPQFNAVDFINDNFTADSPEAQALDAGVSTTPVNAVKLGGLSVAGGTVTVNAAAGGLSGTGSITAYGGPSIAVTNESAAYLVLGAMNIPNLPGGTVNFTGGTTSAPIAVNQVDSGHPPTITINQNYDGSVGNSSYGPALFLTGDITNLGGPVQITNVSGSFGQTASIFGQQVNISVPNGSAVINNPTGAFSVSGNPYSEWQSYIMWPGGNPALGSPDPNQAGQFIINQTYSGIFYIAGELGFREYMNQQTPFLMTADSYASADLSASQNGEAIFGSQITINAKTLDVNGQLSAGKTPPNWSVVLSADLGKALATYAADYANHLADNPVYQLPDSELSTVDAGDSQIAASYDAATNLITIENVSASSGGGGSVTLNGAIINTNTLGQIQVNGGLGQVNVSNQTGIPVVVQNIDADNSSTTAGLSRVQITDTNQPAAYQQTLYVYNPTQGISVYQGAAGAALGEETPVSATSGNSTLYNSETGLRWQWTELAGVSKSLAGNVAFYNAFPKQYSSAEASTILSLIAHDPHNWTWAGSPNNPWLYIDPSNGATTSAPTGQLIVQAGGPVFQESLKVNNTLTWRGLPDLSAQAVMTMTDSVKADNPIGISFLGNTTGEVAISSNADVVLTGLLANANGDTTIAAQPGSISQNATASITTRNLTFNATAGIGSTAQLVNATLTAGGTINSISGSGGDYLNLNSSANGGASPTIGQVSSGTQELWNSAAGGSFTITSTQGSSSQQTALWNQAGNGSFTMSGTVSGRTAVWNRAGGGTFTISVTVSGQTLTTGAIAYNASADAVQAALIEVGVQAFVSGSGTQADPWYITGPSFSSLTIGNAGLTAASTIEPVSTDTREVWNQALSGTFSITVSINGQTGTVGDPTVARQNTDNDSGQIYINNQTFTGLSPAAFSFYAETSGQYLTPLVFAVSGGSYKLAAVYRSILIGQAGPNTVALSLLQGSLDPDTAYVFGYTDRQLSPSGATLTTSAGTVPFDQSSSGDWLCTTARLLPTNYSLALNQVFAVGGGSGSFAIQAGRVYSASVSLVTFAKTATTGNIPYNASAANVAAALDNAGIDATVTGSGTPSDPWVITVPNLNQITTDDMALRTRIGLKTLPNGLDQSFWINASGGSFTLLLGFVRGSTFGYYNTTGAIPYNASAAEIQAALADVAFNVDVTGSGTQADPWVIHKTKDSDASVYISFVTSSELSETTILDVSGEAQQLWNSAVGGTFTISATIAGRTTTTGAVSFNGPAAAVQAALNQVGVPATVTGSGTQADPWVIVARGVTTLSTDDSRLTYGASTVQAAPSWSTGPIAYNASAAQVQAALNVVGVDVTVTGSGTKADPWLLSGNGLKITSTNDDQLQGASTIQSPSAGVETVSNQATGGSFAITAQLDSQTGTVGNIAPLFPSLDKSAGQISIDSQTFRGLYPASFTFFAKSTGQYVTPMVFAVNGGDYTLAAVYQSILISQGGLNIVPLTLLQGTLNLSETYVFGYSDRQVSLDGSTLGTVGSTYAGTIPYNSNARGDWLYTTAVSLTANYTPTLGQTFSANRGSGTYTLNAGRNYCVSVFLSVNAMTATTAYLPYNATAAQIQAALSQVGIPATVTGSGTPANPWVISNPRLAKLRVDDSRLQGGNSTTRQSPFWTTVPINFNASAAVVQQALDALPGVQAYVTGSGTPADPWVISGTGLASLTIQSTFRLGAYTLQPGPAEDVTVVATGNLLGNDNLSNKTANVSGDNVTLTSIDGSIGALNNPVILSAQGTAQTNGGTLGGVVNVTAQNNINLVQQTGDFRVGRITSIDNGSVSLSAPGGAMIDAANRPLSQTLTAPATQAIWQNLGLLDGTAGAQAVIDFQNAVNANYQQYWNLVSSGSVESMSFSLNESAVPLYSQQAVAALGIDNPSTVQVQAYAGDLYGQTVTFLNTNVPGWNSLPDFQKYNPKYAYTATPAQVSALKKNSVLTTNELSYTVNSNGVSPASPDTSVDTGLSDITGGKVTLSGSQGIGQLGQAAVLSLAQLRSGDLTPGEAAALASGTLPGDLLLVGTNAAGQTVQFPYDFNTGTLPAGVTVTGVQVQINAPLLVSATGTLTAASSGNVFIRSVAPTLTVGQVSGGDVHLDAPGNIVGNGSASPSITTTGDLTFSAASGNVGTSAQTPLVVQIGGELKQSSAGDGFYLRQSRGNLVVNNLIAGGQAALSAPAGGITAPSGTVVVQAQSLDLQAAGDVGTSQTPLAVLLSGGELTGTVTGNVSIISNDASTKPFNVGALTSQGGNVTLVVPAGDLNLGQIRAPVGTAAISDWHGNIVNATADNEPNVLAAQIEVSAVSGSIGSAAKSVTLAVAASAHGMVSAYARGDIALSALQGDLPLAQVGSSAGNVFLQAESAIMAVYTGQANVSGANIILTATNGGIGTASQYLVVSATGKVTPTAKQGIFVKQIVGALILGASPVGPPVVRNGPGAAVLSNVLTNSSIEIFELRSKPRPHRVERHPVFHRGRFVHRSINLGTSFLSKRFPASHMDFAADSGHADKDLAGFGPH